MVLVGADGLRREGKREGCVIDDMVCSYSSGAGAQTVRMVVLGAAVWLKIRRWSAMQCKKGSKFLKFQRDGTDQLSTVSEKTLKFHLLGGTRWNSLVGAIAGKWAIAWFESVAAASVRTHSGGNALCVS